MNAEYMMVDPNELVIDLPVDDAHVQELMDSLQRTGRMLEPITVWLRNMRIANGFHRTTAAQRLGWKEVPCMVHDYTEDEFWDARIIAAKPHHKIEAQRLGAWILESWKQSPWYVEEDKHSIIRDYAKYGLTLDESTLTPDVLQRYHAAKTIWGLTFEEEEETGEVKQFTVERGSGKRKRTFTHHSPVNRPRELSPQERWFIDKGQKWGITRSAIRNSLLGALGYGYGDNSPVTWFESMHMKDWSLSFAERNAILEQARIDIATNRHVSELDVEPWVKSVKAGNIISYREFKQHDAERQKREENEERARILAEAQVQHARRQVFLQTEAGKAQAEKERLQQQRSSIAHSLELARYQVRDTKYWLASVPDAPAMLAEFAQFVIDFANEHFPGIEIAKPNPVSLDNARLRAENSKLREQIRSLERALGSKQAAGEMLSSAMAWSSGDLESR